jgi:hypothetical protein
VDTTLAEHWDGAPWTLVPTPSPSTGSDFLNALAPVSATEVWVVGDQANKGNECAGGKTLLEQWNGTPGM